MIKKTIFSISLLAVLVAISCRKEKSSYTPTPPRDVTEVRDENEASIVSYLKTHSYKFENNQVSFDSIAGANAGAEPLFNQVKTLKLDVFDANDRRVTHKLYYLVLQEGSGKQSTIADSVFVVYKGQLLNGKVFDKSVGYSTSNWMDLLGDRTSAARGGTIRGFREAVAQLKDSKTSIESNLDGTLNVPNDGGTGIFFIPSGLGYFSTATGNIPAYSPLIFTINLVKTKNADHDRDGIPSINEIRIEENGVVVYPNCDGDFLVDYVDPDKCD